MLDAFAYDDLETLFYQHCTNIDCKHTVFLFEHILLMCPFQCHLLLLKPYSKDSEHPLLFYKTKRLILLKALFLGLIQLASSLFLGSAPTQNDKADRL